MAYWNLLPPIDKLDLSFTTCLDPKKIITALAMAINVRELHLNSCTQFNQQQLIHLCNMQTKATYIDMQKCDKFTFCNALLVVCNSDHVKTLLIDIKYGFKDAVNWDRLVKQFPTVKFGENVENLVKLHQTGQL